jgi:hypothetical protein
MSNNLVNGFRDIIAAPNFVTNGRFLINQRGNFSSWSQLVVNDYISDAWYVEGNTFDYTECSSESGVVNFRGYGKKGQRIIIRNKDTSRVGHSGNSDDYDTFTSAMDLFNFNGVPVAPHVIPPNSPSLGVLYQNTPVVEANQKKETVTVVKSPMYQNLSYASTFTVDLEADGEFNFLVRNFRTFAGAYRNPPKFAPVPYADDMARCERYFQKGNSGGHGSWHQVPIVRSTNDFFSVSNYFRTTMAGIPTISVGDLEISLAQSASIGSASQQNDHGNWTTSAQSPKNTGFRLDANRNSLLGTYDVAQVHYGWVAEV